MSDRYPNAPADFTLAQKDAWNRLIQILEQRDRRTFSGTASPQAYTVSVSASYAVSSASTLVQTADTLGTLLTNLKQKGIIS